MDVKSKVLGWVLAAIVSITAFEGVRYYAYKDPLGIPTVCVGHTGPDVKFGVKYTKTQCDAFLAEDIGIAYATVRHCYPGIDSRTDGEKEAWTSFTLNVGPGGRNIKDGFCRLKSGLEPSLLRKLKAGDFRGACYELPKWDSPKNLLGLAKRRQFELATCLKGL